MGIIMNETNVENDCLFYNDPQPLLLESGQIINGHDIAYKTYGSLNSNRDNAILICHALSGDQYVASSHPITNKDGWWSRMVGKGKPIDTDRYFILCINVLGGCMGSSGPASLNPDNGKVFAINFPVITIADMVKAQVRLIDYLGIEKLVSVIGGSMGGMQALEWAASYPEKLNSVIPIATSSRHTAQNIAFHELGRQAIMADINWKSGNYINEGTNPSKGLSIARMTAHVTYLSEASLTKKFGRKLQDKTEVGFGFDADFQIESYLRHQGHTFVDRFDANSYLYITRAMDYFDLEKTHKKTLTEIFTDTKVKFLVVSFTGDWLYPTSENLMIVRALSAGGVDVSFVEIESDKGHDAFLLEEPEFDSCLDGFLKSL
tara:strand:+ start:330 stop:1457 length:1128 start_codon:yes stop_codon:yes gene_type:complete